jgi:hypothetical protein
VKQRGLAGSFWPSQQQLLLLQTALWQDGRAAEAWRKVRPSLDFDVLELGSVALLPLVYRRLATLAVDEPELPRLKGLYRRAWYENQVLVDALQTVSSRLRDAGCRLITFGSASLLLRYYGDLGLRRLPWIDLLIPGRQAELVSQALASLGFARIDTATRGPVPFRDARDRTWLVHTQPPLELLVPGRPERSADACWEAAVETSVGEPHLLTLSAADELLLTSLLGAKPAAYPCVDWVADAATIVADAGDSLDWERLLARASEVRLVLRLREALVYLSQALEVPVPDSILLQLERAPSTRRDAIVHRLSAHSSRVLGGLPDTIATHLRLTSQAGVRRTIATLPDYLQRTWGLKHPWHLPFIAIGKALGAIPRALRPAPRGRGPRRPSNRRAPRTANH